MKLEYAVAVDFGSTTLAFRLVEMQSKKSIHTVTMLNSQRKFGADVLTRICASVDGKRDELRQCARLDLATGIARLMEECKKEQEQKGREQIELEQKEKEQKEKEQKGREQIELEQKEQEQKEQEQIKQVVIAGNTAMVHFLQGYDCSGLGSYPFTPVNLEFVNTTAKTLGLHINRSEMAREKEADTPDITIFPGISAFVGGDIVSGLYALDFINKEEISLLIDLGTNGEMVLGNRNRAIAASVAAGPAFERGAVIWGSDVIDITSRLLREGIMDETGLLMEQYFDKGYPVSQTEDGRQIFFTQQDIRKLQLAKAAVRAGIETLIEEYGIVAEQIDKVYLAGGFGYYLDAKKAAFIGMIPQELAEKTESVGNSSLAGCVKYLQNACAEEDIKRIVSTVSHVELANNDNFQKKYVKNMLFSL